MHVHFIKKIFKILAGSAVFLVLLPFILTPIIYLFWFFPYDGVLKTQNSSYPIEKLNLESASQLHDANSIEWLDNNTLFIAGDDDAIIYDVNKQKIDLKHSSLPFIDKFYSTLCVSKYGSMLKFNTEKNQNYPVDRAYFIEDPKKPSAFKKIMLDSYWTPDKLECLPKIHDNPEKEFELAYKEKELAYHAGNKLLLKKHGETGIFIINKKDLFVAKKDNKTERIKLEFSTPFKHPRSLYSDYDDAMDEYLWYPKRKNLSLDPNSKSSKTKVWRVTPRLNLIHAYTLPAGPWIYEDYALCFSAGCAMYDRVHLKLNNGRIFAHVYGAGVKWKHKGIYRLSEDLSKWEPIVTGDIGKDTTITPDGCKIAYLGPSPGFIDICPSK